MVQTHHCACLVVGLDAFHRTWLGKRSAVMQCLLLGDRGPVAQLERTAMREVALSLKARCRHGTGALLTVLRAPIWVDRAVSDLDHHPMVKTGISRFPIVGWDDATSGRWAAGNCMRLKCGLVSVERV